MNKGLEALEHMNKNIIVAEDIDEDVEIIKKELKEGEKDHELKVEICEYFGLDDLFPYNDNSKIMEKLKETQSHYYDIQFKKSKKEKALEIIKEKKVFVANLIYHFENDDNIINYNRSCGWAKSELSLQEYELLKEVLL